MTRAIVPQVLRALDALTTEPEGFIDNASIYLSLRTLLHGLERDGSRAGLKSATDGLWDIALRIEDGDLSDAEKALRDAQDKLAEALEKGAPDYGDPEPDAAAARCAEQVRRAVGEEQQGPESARGSRPG